MKEKTNLRTIPELQQNTEEWHKWRQEGIGASEANIIMGKSRFMTKAQLWDEKVNGKKKDEKDNSFITDKGHRLEIKNRAMHEMRTGLEFPDMLAISEQHPFLRASLDGYNEKENIVAEYKYCGEDDFNLVKSGKILEQYKPQVMQQLFVTGAKICHLCVVTEEKDENGKAIKDKFKYADVEIEPDLTYIENDLVPALFDFWDSVQEKQKPVLSEKDVLAVKDAELGKLLTRYKNAKTKSDEFAKLEKDLKKEIFKLSLAHHNKVECKGFKISESISEDSTAFDYKKFEAENPIEKKYIKITKGRKTQRITFPS